MTALSAFFSALIRFWTFSLSALQARSLSAVMAITKSLLGSRRHVHFEAKTRLATSGILTSLIW